MYYRINAMQCLHFCQSPPPFRVPSKRGCEIRERCITFSIVPVSTGVTHLLYVCSLYFVYPIWFIHVIFNYWCLICWVCFRTFLIPFPFVYTYLDPIIIFLYYSDVIILYGKNVK